jgi:hypothetical protein
LKLFCRDLAQVKNEQFSFPAGFLGAQYKLNRVMR